MDIRSNRLKLSAILIFVVAALASAEPRPPSAYCWPHRPPQAGNCISQRFAPPAGYKRVAATKGGFGEWLRGLPLLPGPGVVHLHDGQPKSDQKSHAAVIDIDVGEANLQQCADAVIRLRAEYQFAAGDFDTIRFHFTNGDVATYADWRRGMRPSVKGNRVAWAAKARADNSYAGFRKYLDTVFTYAGTMSLSKELDHVADPADVRIGDVFVDPGSPGHAVIVVDMVEHETTHRRLILLAQSYMPAQQIHVVDHPGAAERPWYELRADRELVTPHWTFRADQLRRFRQPATKSAASN